jgi:hypothetical protein
MANTTTSRKLIAEWSDSIKVGIYDNCTWRIRLYHDRAVVKMPGVKWEGNTGGYHEYIYRIVGDDHAMLLEIAKNQEVDGEEYSEEAYEIASDYCR